MSHEFESGMFAHEPAWHGLGTVLDHAPSYEEAIIAASVDWAVEKRRLYFPDEEGEGILVPDFYATVRSSDLKPLGIVGEKYSILQNIDAFRFVDELLGEGITFESAGSLKGGKCVFLLARMPEQVVLGDGYKPYFLFSNWHDGTGRAKAVYTMTRVACWNTLNMALKDASNIVTIVHTGDLKDKMDNAMKTLKMAKEYSLSFGEAAEAYQQKQITRSDLSDIIMEVWPEKKEETGQEEKNRLETVSRFLEACKAPDLRKFEGSAWGLLNAFSDFASHAEPRRKSEDWKENRFLSLYDGSSVFNKAQRVVNGLVGMSV